MPISLSLLSRSSMVWLVAVSACRGGTPLSDLAEARRLSSELRIHFTTTVEASNRAVIAETDDASDKAATEARDARAAVERTASALRSRLATLGYADEQMRLEEFSRRFADYEQLDGALSQRNANVRVVALSLSRKPVVATECREALDGLERAVLAHSFTATR